MLSMPSLSVPFIPPAKEYVPLEMQVERFPNWGYQLFFQEKSANVAVEKQVSIICVAPLMSLKLIRLAYQLSRFFRLIFRVRKGTEGLSNWTRPGGLKALFEAKEGSQRDTGHLTQEVGGASLPLSTAWLTLIGLQEHDYYLSQFANSMNGPLNYYRTTRHRFEEEIGQS